MKRYISPGSWFAFNYPNEWHEFQESQGNGFLFYNPDVWSGNFRISAANDASPRFAEETMREELHQYKDAKMVELGGRKFIYSTEEFEEEGQLYTSHYWVTGERNVAIYCSFTMNEKGRLEEAEYALSTLQVFDPQKPCLYEIIPIRLMEVASINDAYEKALKAVKQELKKDFSSATAEASIGHLQKLMDKGVKTACDPMVLGSVLGCFLVDEFNGIEWVTVIDKRNEYPALLYVSGDNCEKRLLAPISFVDICKGKTLMEIYEEMKNYIL